jgi:hypothetical protein
LGDLNEVKLQALVEEMGKIVFAAGCKDIMSLHSPKNFGGTRSCPENKVVCMLGIGS